MEEPFIFGSQMTTLPKKLVSIQSVSYTHLDVYKRQVVFIPDCLTILLRHYYLNKELNSVL